MSDKRLAWIMVLTLSAACFTMGCGAIYGLSWWSGVTLPPVISLAVWAAVACTTVSFAVMWTATRRYEREQGL